MRTFVRCSRRTIAVGLLGGLMGSGALMSPAGAATAKADSTGSGASSQFSCLDTSHQVVGGGMVVSSLSTVQGETSGWVHFFADNGQRAKYFEDYTVRPNGGGGEDVGSVVTGAGPLYGNNWLYITGTADFAPGGYLGSYSGTVVDICAQLGYPGTF